MRTFVMGDIHGAYKALEQCLARAPFDPALDRLIVLGDVCDVYPQVNACIDTLLSLKHCDFIIGNHDLWALDWAMTGRKPAMWLEQGGAETMASYGGAAMPQAHIDFLNRGLPWLEVAGRVFVHAGFDPDRPLKEQGLRRLAWDRALLSIAVMRRGTGPIGCYREIFLGHTPTMRFGSTVPFQACNVWAMDTGAGWSGKLSIMDVESKEFWQSDTTPGLYGVAGRGDGRRPGPGEGAN